MKNNDIFLYGGLAVLAYLFLKPKTVAPGVTQVAPVNSYVPPVNNNNTTNQLLTAAAGLVPVVTKFFTNPAASNPAQAAAAANASYVPVYNNSVPDLSSIITPTLPSPVDTYAAAPVPDFTAEEMMFQNGDYPGASLSGLNDRIAACIGEY